MSTAIETPDTLVTAGLVQQQKPLGKTGLTFPLILHPSEAGLAAGLGPDSATGQAEWARWLSANKAWVTERLLEYGAIVFRGFFAKTPADFDAFVEAFGYVHLPYVGGAAPRTRVVGNVFTTNESPPDVPIPFHHEMAQVPNYPQRLFFFCEVPPTSGGETPLCPSTAVYDRMAEAHPDFVEKLRTLGVRYVRVLPDGDDNTSPIGRGWQSTFAATTREEAEARCKTLGNEWEWLPDGSMKTISKVLPAMKQHPVTGKWAWFNSIIAAFTGWVDTRNIPEKAVVFGDNSPMDKQPVLDCLAIMNELAVDLPWQVGDVYLVDNHQTLHARRNFVPPRSIYAALIKE